MFTSAMINGYRHPFLSEMEGLESGVQKCWHHAPSWPLLHLHSNSRMQSILPASIRDLEDVNKTEAFSSWIKLSRTEESLELRRTIQRVWHGAVASAFQADLLARADTPTDRARLFSACVDHSGDWLNAPPITAVSLRLNDEMNRISVGTRLGARMCELHTYPCGKTVDARGLHSLSCRKSATRHQRHSNLNDIIWRVVKRSQIPAVKEQVGLSRLNGKWPDEATLIPWASEKALTWNVTLQDTFAQSHVEDTAILAGAVANHAATKKISKYQHLTDTNICVPVAVETGGAWNIQAIEFIEELGKRITAVTNEPMDTQYLFQRISIAIQWGNAVSFLKTFSED